MASSSVAQTVNIEPLLDSSTSETIVRFHLSLNVGDLDQSIAFYSALFGVAPAKTRRDYAKFEILEPPLVLSLIPGAHSGGGALNHVGVRVVDAQKLVAAQARLEMAGYRTQREEGVACCYAMQTKFWATDPDRTLWEIYVLHGDVEQDSHHHAGAGDHAGDADHAGHAEHSDHACESTGQPAASTIKSTFAITGMRASEASSCAPAAMRAAASPSVWRHSLAQPLPERIELADASCDEVHLQGTFNVPHDPARLAAFLAEARRVLRPGGQVLTHELVADGPLVQAPALPGPAALVSHVPLEGFAAETLAAAGFVHAQITKLAPSPCFTVDRVELRESKSRAMAPGEAATCGATSAGSPLPVGAAADSPTLSAPPSTIASATDAASATIVVIYRGPFQAVTDDEGHRFERGRRTAICATTLANLRSGPMAESFIVLDSAGAPAGCGAS